MVNHLAKARFITGYLDIRFNHAYGDKDKDLEINVWASELTKFSDEQLSDEFLKQAVDYYVDISHNKGKAPTVDQFCAALRKVSYVERVQLPHNEPNWFAMFDAADNKGKFSFFMRGRKIPSLVRVHAREWFKLNTKFSKENIDQIINGKLPT